MIVLLVTIGAPSDLYALGADDGPRCADSIVVATGATHLGWRGGVGKAFCYQLEIESSGVLMVSALVPGAAPAQPKLRLDDGPRSAKPELLGAGWSAASLILRIPEPGVYVFAVAPQDPRRALGEHALISRFVADADAVELALRGRRGVTRSGEDGEIDPILVRQGAPDGCVDERFKVAMERPGVALFASDDALAFVRPGQELRLDSCEGRPPVARFYDLCRLESVADADALLACAAAVRPGQRVRGELLNSWMNDRDVFTFFLAEQQTVQLELGGVGELIGTLHDRWGQRLAMADDGERGGALRFVRTLAPGRYFVRIEDRHGAEGAYSLALETLPW